MIRKLGRRPVKNATGKRSSLRSPWHMGLGFAMPQDFPSAPCKGRVRDRVSGKCIAALCHVELWPLENSSKKGL